MSFSLIFGALRDGSQDNEETGTSSSQGIEEANEDVKSIIELPPEDEREVTFDREVQIGNIETDTIEYDNVEDYLKIMDFRDKNRNVDLTGDSAQNELYYISSGADNGAQGDEDTSVPYFNLKNTCQNKPVSCGSDLYSTLENTLGDNFDTSGEEQVYSEVQSLATEIEGLKDQDELSQDQQQELNELEDELEEKRSFLEKTMSGTEFTDMALQGRVSQENLNNVYGQCSGIMGSLNCFLGNKVTLETNARRSVQEARQDVLRDSEGDLKEVTSDCDDDDCMTLAAYNDELEKKINQRFPEIEEQCGDSINECDVSSLKDSCSDMSSGPVKNNCFTNAAVVESLQEEYEDQQQVQITGIAAFGYGALQTILNVDQQALQAAEFFGYESQFNNLPEALREDFPSQVCMYEIDGYLNEQRNTAVGGVQGSTQYGCLNQKSVNIDEETGNAEVVGNHPCLQVIGDIRAQRTPLTPNNEVDISFSSYMQAPPGTTINGKVIAQYTLDEQVNEVLSDFTISDGDTKSLNKIFSIPDNSTKHDFDKFDDSQTVKILLKGKYQSGGTYVNLKTDAYKIVGGDQYEDPLGQN